MNADSEPLLTLENVSKTFEAAGPVLRGISFDICRNQFTVLLGPNGCGKTTLVRLIVGALAPDPGPGKITFGETVSCSTQGIAFQKPLLLPWLTVEENIQLPLRLLRLDANDYQERLDTLLTLAELQDVRTQYPAGLSGGQRQKIALMRALITKPQLLVMDEPFSSLDDKTREDLQNHFVQLQAKEQLSILFVTHDLVEACLMADEIIVLSRRPASVVSRIPMTTDKMTRRESADLDEQVLNVRRRLREEIYA